MGVSVAELPGLEDIKASVESTYPTPIAAVFRRCRVASREDLGGRHKNLMDLFEVFVKYLCVVQLQEARQVVPNLRDRLPQKDKTLQFLKRPSIGGWLGLLRILCGLGPGSAEPVWMRRIADWYAEPKTVENSAALAALGEIEGVKYEKRTKAPNAEICNALVNYRNKQLAHAANLRDEELTKRLPVLEGALAHLLRSASFLGEMTTFHAQRIEVAENSQWLVHASRLTGSTDEPTTFVTASKPELSEVYLTDRPKGKLEGTPVPLGPFILWQVNEELKQSEVYFYNDAWRTKLEYLSYTSGAYYYHKELHSGFGDLITLKLKPGVEEDAYRFMPPEERAERAEELFKRAKVLAEQDRLEDSLEALEQSAEYERRADTFLEMARVQRELGDPPDAVRQTLQSCLDIDSANAAANEILRGLAGDEEDVSATPGKEAAQAIEAPTLFHALTPRAVRGWTPAWWLGLSAAWYVSSASVEYATGHTEGLLPNLMQFLMSVLGMALVVTGRSLVLRLQLPLSLQLDSMRLERFNKWFEEQLVSVFFFIGMGARRTPRTAPRKHMVNMSPMPTSKRRLDHGSVSNQDDPITRKVGYSLYSSTPHM
jgi:hypothetical protein